MLNHPAIYWSAASITFLCEALLVFGAGVATWHLASPAGMVVVALAVTVVLVVTSILWASFMSPRASRRIPALPRAAIAGLACLGTGVVLIQTGTQPMGITLVIAGPILFAGQLVMARNWP